MSQPDDCKDTTGVWAALSLLEPFLLEDHNAIYELIPRPGLFPNEGFDQLTNVLFLLMHQGGCGVADRCGTDPGGTADRRGYFNLGG